MELTYETMSKQILTTETKMMELVIISLLVLASIFTLLNIFR
jgi:hypothetical protein